MHSRQITSITGTHRPRSMWHGMALSHWLHRWPWNVASSSSLNHSQL
jgi:hypothetical protein